jgi:MFS family permease
LEYEEARFGDRCAVDDDAFTVRQQGRQLADRPPAYRNVVRAARTVLRMLIDARTPSVIAVRAAMGIGAALIMPATLSVIANLFTGKERGKAIGIWAALAGVGIGLGPLTGGLLLERFDWSSIFMVNVPFAVAALLFGIR